MVGVARGAVDEICGQAREGASKTRAKLVEDPVAMADLATAETRLRATTAAFHEALNDTWQLALVGDRVGTVAQARVLMACQLIGDVADEVASTAHRLGGGSAAYASSPLGRRLQDVQTARQHVMFSHSMRNTLGKAIAGLDVREPPFLV